MSEYVYANQSGVRQLDGTPVYFTINEAWRADDPFVRAYPQLFNATPPTVRGTTPAPAAERVERATRRPGERRG